MQQCRAHHVQEAKEKHSAAMGNKTADRQNHRDCGDDDAKLFAKPSAENCSSVFAEITNSAADRKRIDGEKMFEIQKKR